MFGVIALVLFVIAFINGEADIELIIILLLVAGVGMPCFIIMVSYLAWYYKEWSRQKAFSIPPFDSLIELDFTDALINEKSRWHFTEKVKVGEMNGFRILSDILYDETHIIEFRIFSSAKDVNRNEYKRLTKLFKPNNIEFDFGNCVKRYNIKKLLVHSVDDIKRDLEEITNLLISGGFKPKDWA